MDEARARSVAAGGGRRDLKGLRESSRLACAVPMLDPVGLAAELKAIASDVLPSPGEFDERLTRAVLAFDKLVSSANEPGFVQWETLREIQDALAVSLLSLHPLRYQKPKWVVADLDEIGRNDLAAALLRSYASDGKADLTSRTLQGVENIFASIAGEYELPSVEAVLAHGFVEALPGWSYACRTFADATSLLAEGATGAADFTAKFSARRALSIETELSNASHDADPETKSTHRRLKMYRRLFSSDAEVPPPTDEDLEVCGAWIGRVMEARGRLF
jgi:hypothetical protein